MLIKWRPMTVGGPGWRRVCGPYTLYVRQRIADLKWYIKIASFNQHDLVIAENYDELQQAQAAAEEKVVTLLVGDLREMDVVLEETTDAHG